MDQKLPIDNHDAEKVISPVDSPIPENGSVILPQTLQTKRGLSPRHVQLMAIASSIGIGLFVGIGGVLSKAGPISLILGYLIYGLGYIWPLALCTGEMVAWLPIRGSIYELANRYVDPALGFAMGWTYFFASVMLVCTEYSAVATVIQYWNTDVNPAVWVALAMAVCFFLNMVAVKWYGEAEFVFGSSKVLLIIGLIMVTFITMVGGNPHHDTYGFRNWTKGQAMRPYYTDGDTGRFLGIFACIRYAVFTLGGPDFIALSAGEIQNPRHTVPRVARLIIYRILGFYVIGALAVGILCPSRLPELLSAIKNSEPGAGASPWVAGIRNVGIVKFLPDLINFLIMTSGWSCGNAFLYSSSRTLYSLAQDGQAPKIFLRVNRLGIPWVAVSAVTLISCITFLVSSNSALEVFNWFVDLTTCGLIVNQTAYFAVFICWMRALDKQGVSRDSLPYRAPFGPIVAWICLVAGVVITLFLGFDNFQPWDLRGFITSYFGLLWGVLMFILWKVVKKTKMADTATADVYGGKAAIDAECSHWENGGLEENERMRLAQMGFVNRMWHKIW
ncbi:amino acid transporter [Pleomassaria siparia CBS 279.74]|uniref:Amino acid transporter n=1 Tax=Pleomassaria siparia CBS 279.74 TaxID=1314801 RepID=A0A6G1KMM7_9PLEO|nr:amino acid transporter [Pleomassaria siparia CBS 279.74]